MTDHPGPLPPPLPRATLPARPPLPPVAAVLPLPLTRAPEAGQTVVAAPLRRFTLPDWLRRALRTALQSFLGILLAQWIQLALAPGVLPTWDVAQRLLIAAGLAALVSFVSAVQNALEDTTGHALLKAKPGEVVAP